MNDVPTRPTLPEASQAHKVPISSFERGFNSGVLFPPNEPAATLFSPPVPVSGGSAQIQSVQVPSATEGNTFGTPAVYSTTNPEPSLFQQFWGRVISMFGY